MEGTSVRPRDHTWLARQGDDRLPYSGGDSPRRGLDPSASSGAGSSSGSSRGSAPSPEGIDRDGASFRAHWTTCWSDRLRAGSRGRLGKGRGGETSGRSRSPVPPGSPTRSLRHRRGRPPRAPVEIRDLGPSSDDDRPTPQGSAPAGLNRPRGEDEVAGTGSEGRTGECAATVRTAAAHRRAEPLRRR